MDRQPEESHLGVELAHFLLQEPSQTSIREVPAPLLRLGELVLQLLNFGPECGW